MTTSPNQSSNQINEGNNSGQTEAEQAYRRPWLTYAGMGATAVFSVSFVCAACNIDLTEGYETLSLILGLVFVGSIFTAGYGLFDKYVLSRGKPLRKSPHVGRFAGALLAGTFLFSVVATGLDMFAQYRRIEQRRAPRGETFALAGTPFWATLPDGWHQMNASDPGVLLQAGNPETSVVVSFSATPVVDLPLASRSPEGLLEAWTNSMRASTEECEIAEPTKAILLGQPCMQRALEATLADPAEGGIRARLRWIKTIALVDGYVCELMVTGVPSRVLALGESGLAQVMEVVHVANP